MQGGYARSPRGSGRAVPASAARLAWTSTASSRSGHRSPRPARCCGTAAVARVDRDFDPRKPECEGREEADRAGAEHRSRGGPQTRSRRWISKAWRIPFSTMLIGSSRTPTESERRRSGTRKEASVGVVLGEEAVGPPDAALREVVGRRHVVKPIASYGEVPGRRLWPRPAFPGVADLDVRPDRLDLPEALVADDQEVLTGRRLADSAALISRSVPHTPTRSTLTRTPWPPERPRPTGRGTIADVERDPSRPRRWPACSVRHARPNADARAGTPSLPRSRIGRQKSTGPGSTSPRSMPSRTATPADSRARCVPIGSPNGATLR